MKKIILPLVLLLLNLTAYAQLIKSYSVTKMTPKADLEIKDRVITITDKEISITNFVNGGKETLFIGVDRIEDKIWSDPISGDKKCKTYYGTSKYKGPYSENQKAILYIRDKKVNLGLFADEITVYLYQFLTE